MDDKIVKFVESNKIINVEKCASKNCKSFCITSDNDIDPENTLYHNCKKFYLCQNPPYKEDFCDIHIEEHSKKCLRCYEKFS